MLDDTLTMASVNLTCTTCTSDALCERCRSITRALRAAGHAVTQSSRYDALRAAALGNYGFDACVLAVAQHEAAIIDAAGALLSHTRVALVAEPGALPQIPVPPSITVVEAADLQGRPFPTGWVEGASAGQRGVDETRSFASIDSPPAGSGVAQRRLKAVARRAQRGLAAAGFPEGGKLELIATLEDEIAWAKMSGSCFGLALIHVAQKNGASAANLERALALICRHVERAVRESDAIAQSTDSIIIIIAEATAEDTRNAVGRVKKALRRAVKEAARDKTLESALRRITVGIAVYPTNGMTRAALLGRATASAAPL